VGRVTPEQRSPGHGSAPHVAAHVEAPGRTGRAPTGRRGARNL